MDDETEKYLAGYRPITDVIIPARPKLLDNKKFYGAWPAGMLERARAMMGVSIFDPVLFVCSGLTRHYAYQKHAVGPNDKMLDLDPETKPDFLQDARDPYPTGFRAVIADPPYSVEEAKNYKPGPEAYPTPGVILRRSLEVLPPGGRVGILHFKSPSMPKHGVRLVAMLPVWMGFNMAIRSFTVYEQLRWTKQTIDYNPED